LIWGIWNTPIKQNTSTKEKRTFSEQLFL